MDSFRYYSDARLQFVEAMNAVLKASLNGEYAVQLETLDTWLYENKVDTHEGFYEKVSDLTLRTMTLHASCYQSRVLVMDGRHLTVGHCGRCEVCRESRDPYIENQVKARKLAFDENLWENWSFT